MAKKPDRTPTPDHTAEPPELPERWSVQRKQAVVLRLLRGEPLDQVSRDTQVPAHELEPLGEGRRKITGEGVVRGKRVTRS